MEKMGVKALDKIAFDMHICPKCRHKLVEGLQTEARTARSYTWVVITWETLVCANENCGFKFKHVVSSEIVK